MPRGRPVMNPHNRHPSHKDASPERLLELSRKDPTDRAAAIAARCCQCNPDAESIRRCPRRTCALYALRPYQADVEPRSAPHHDYVPPSWEKPLEAEESEDGE
jgi:hypothetical protein